MPISAGRSLARKNHVPNQYQPFAAARPTAGAGAITPNIASFEDPDAEPLLGALDSQITLVQVGMHALHKQQQQTTTGAAS